MIKIWIYYRWRNIEQVKFSYSQIKTIEDEWIKQAEALKPLKSIKNKQEIKSIVGIFPKEMRANEIKNEVGQIRKYEENMQNK